MLKLALFVLFVLSLGTLAVAASAIPSDSDQVVADTGL